METTLKELILNNIDSIVAEYKKGRSLQEIFYVEYGITDRRKTIQTKIDAMNRCIWIEDTAKAKKLFDELSTVLPDDDSAILYARNSLELIEDGINENDIHE